MSGEDRPRKINPRFLLNESDPAEGRPARQKLRVPERKAPVVPNSNEPIENEANETDEVVHVSPGKLEVPKLKEKPKEQESVKMQPEVVIVDSSPMKNPYLPSNQEEDEAENALYEAKMDKIVQGLTERDKTPENAAQDATEVSEVPTIKEQEVHFAKLPVPSKRTVNPMFQPQGATKKTRQRNDKKKVGLLLDSSDWDENSGEVAAGSGDLDENPVKAKPGTGFHLTARDIVIMRFLARYRYAYHRQLASLLNTTPDKIANRLRVLVKRGFIRKEAVSPRQFLFTNRKAGNQIVDIPFPEIRKGQISYATIPHTVGLANLGVEFERETGGEDLLGEGKGIIDWVQPMNRWKNGLWYNGEKTFGEMTVTEREIRQGQVRWRGGRSAQEMRDIIYESAMSGEAIELEEGQEGMFVVYGMQNQGGEHVPDMVIARERDENGRPQHIAVELELTPKNMTEWKKILRNYRDNGIMYSKVYYFTHKQTIANSIKRADLDVGLGDRLVVRKYEPSDRSMPFWG